MSFPSPVLGNDPALLSVPQPVPLLTVELAESPRTPKACPQMLHRGLLFCTWARCLRGQAFHPFMVWRRGMGQLFSRGPAWALGKSLHISKLYILYLSPPLSYRISVIFTPQESGLAPSALLLPPDSHFLRLSPQDLMCVPPEHCSDSWKMYLPSP